MGSVRMYKSDLMRSTNNLNNARDKVLTQRNFNSYAEDPASATLSFKLRRQFSSTSDQLTNVNTLVSRTQSAWTAVESVKQSLEDATKNCGYRGNNDPTASGRIPLGQVLDNHAESIVQTLNGKFGDSYVFSGSDGLTTPFSWDETTGDLLYRGISVNSGLSDPLNPPVRPDGDPPRSNEATGDWATYYAANEDYAKLVDMTYETAFIDVGAGLAELEVGKVNSATAFDSSICGLDFLNFGMDEDGDPLNVVSLIKELGSIYKNCNPDTGAYADGDEDRALRLTQKMEDALGVLTNAWTDLDGKSSYLEEAKLRLTDDAYNLNEQILGLEQVDMADAITDFSWAQYCYNASLKVGTDILSQSLIDYMR